MESDGLNIFSDGGARGNPGPGACAFVIRKGNSIVSQGSKYLGKVTNNFAEYSGVILALKWMADNLKLLDSDERITFFMDSELVVNQINGKYKIKNKTLWELYQKIQQTINKQNFKIVFKSIPRD